MLPQELREDSVSFVAVAVAEPEAPAVSWPVEAISRGFYGLPGMHLPRMDFQILVDVKRESWSQMVVE